MRAAERMKNSMNQQEEMLREITELIETDSATGNERAVAEILKKKLAALGFAVTEDKAGDTFGGNCGNLFAVREGERAGSLLLSSHMDRVPNGYGIRPVVRDGILYSDGTTILAADDLAGVCAILGGVRKALASGKALPRIEILFTVAEETGLLGAKAADLSAVQSKAAYVVDSSGPAGRAIVGAPSYMKLKAEFFGKASHAGVAPEKGVDAAKVLAVALAQLPTGRLDEITTANFPILRTGTEAVNIVCDYALLQGEARSHDAARLDAYTKNFERACREAAESLGARAEVTTELSMEAFAIRPEDAIYQAVEKACEAIGIPMRPEVGGGGMDANVFNARGLASIGLGAGYSKNHTNEEQLDLAEFYRTADLVAALIDGCGEA